MLTNTYTPFVGGLERSIQTFTERLRGRGHRVKIVAPVFANTPIDEEDVIRVPAIQRFNGTDFSLQLPVPGMLKTALEGFRPDIIHTHHPYLIGDTALRLATSYEVPLVFTFHTLYEHYSHYSPIDSPQYKRFIITLSTGFCNLCDRVIAPSASIKTLLAQRGVIRPISVAPTGIDIGSFLSGDGAMFRREAGIPPDAFVVGTVARIAPEKNLAFLQEVLLRFLSSSGNAHFLMVGDGPSLQDVKDVFRARGLADRLHAVGALSGQQLVDGYHAMDLFAFASQTETQGMVLTESMASGVPVVALDGPGVRDVLHNQNGGKLIDEESLDDFVKALGEYDALPEQEYAKIRIAAQEEAKGYSHEICTDNLLSVYKETLSKELFSHEVKATLWKKTRQRLGAEMSLWSNVAQATHDAIALSPETVEEMQ